MIREAYLKTIFIVEDLNAGWNDASFAIITAWNPDGTACDDETNQKADEGLRNVLRLHATCQKIERITGASPDRSHREPGWAAFGLSLEEALAIGKQFRQEAIYWVEKGDCDVVSCTDNSRKRLDEFLVVT